MAAPRAFRQARADARTQRLCEHRPLHRTAPGRATRGGRFQLPQTGDDDPRDLHRALGGGGPDLRPDRASLACGAHHPARARHLGVTWMFGLLCAYLMRPHTVGPAGIRVRDGLETDIALSWDDIASVARNLRVDEPKSPKIEETDASRRLLLRINNETDVEIELERPTVVQLPGHGRFGGEQVVTALRIWVDDPVAFMEEVRKYI